MKKTNQLLIACLLFTVNVTFSQPWFRGGNSNTPPAPPIIGSDATWNSFLQFNTFGQERMRINANQTQVTTNAVQTFLGGPQNTSGYIGIGLNPTQQAPWSRLHIGVPSGPAATQAYGGYRDWMGEGVTIQRKDDQLFMGHYQWGTNVDQQNAVINWGDDQSAGAGPDHMVFNYTESTYTGPYAGASVAPNAQQRFGIEIMRLTGSGQVGIGPRFSNGFIPQSTLHQHQQNSSQSWFQISNQASPVAGNAVTNVNAPTAITGLDGLRLGIDGANNAYLFNQENRHLTFSTNAPTSNLAAERFRITAIGTPGTNNPGAIANNRTRVSISHDPAQPLNNPLSLLHLGYNTQNFGAVSQQGWRPWMDVGMFVVQAPYQIMFIWG